MAHTDPVRDGRVIEPRRRILLLIFTAVLGVLVAFVAPVAIESRPMAFVCVLATATLWAALAWRLMGRSDTSARIATAMLGFVLVLLVGVGSLTFSTALAVI